MRVDVGSAALEDRPGKAWSPAWSWRLLTACASLLGVPPEAAGRLIAELTSTALITEHRPGRYSLHELTRSYATELSESTDTNTERHEALARLHDHAHRRRGPGCRPQPGLDGLSSDGLEYVHV